MAAIATAPVPPSAAAAPAPLTGALVPVGPIRLADTRRDDCGCTRLDATTIAVDVAGRAGVPDGTIAAAVTVTALRTTSRGFVTVHPSDVERPGVSTVNTRPDGTVANGAIVALGADGAIHLHGSVPGELVVDLTAVFVPADRSRAGRFVPVVARRLADTRSTAPLPPGGSLTIPIPPEVDPDASAVVVNVTSVRETGPGFLTARPSGADAATTSILNPDGSGLPVAAATIVPVDTGGVAIDSYGGGHVVVDLLGWFTGPGADESDIGLFVPAIPRRVLDTRQGIGRIHPDGTIETPLPVDGAAALVTNVTVVRPDHRGFVTAYPAGSTAPSTSTVNPTAWNHTVANLAITNLGERGLAYRATTGTDLAVDLTGWFTGAPVAATTPPPPNEPTRSRVLLVGDSTLAALQVFPAAQAAFVGFDGTVDAESCRRLSRTSCRSDITGRVPSTAVEAIGAAPGRYDVVVVKAGYNDWFSDFPAEFDAVVRAARAKGAHTILWLSYNTRVSRSTARRAYEENNADLRVLAGSPAYADVLLADWRAYSDARREWFWDGTHLTTPGTWAIADYISRWIAAIEHRPCPRPWAAGGPLPEPCPAPDLVGAPTDPAALY